MTYKGEPMTKEEINRLLQESYKLIDWTISPKSTGLIEKETTMGDEETQLDSLYSRKGHNNFLAANTEVRLAERGYNKVVIKKEGSAANNVVCSVEDIPAVCAALLRIYDART